VGAIVAYLAILADFMLPSFSEHPASTFLVAFVAGASERFVPTLIEKVEIGGAEKNAEKGAKAGKT
jgi:hypothetical protein